MLNVQNIRTQKVLITLKTRTIQLLENQEADYKRKLSTKLDGDFIPSSLNCDSLAFEWMLNRLILPSHKIISRGIDIFIPETVFYRDGEVTGLFMNKDMNVYFCVT